MPGFQGLALLSCAPYPAGLEGLQGCCKGAGPLHLHFLGGWEWELGSTADGARWDPRQRP